MLITVIEFAFVTLGVKLVLAVAVVYALFPADRRCPRCDAETLRLVTGRGFVRLGRLVHVARRWCPSCGDSYLARYCKVDVAPVSPRRSARAARRGG